MLFIYVAMCILWYDIKLPLRKKNTKTNAGRKSSGREWRLHLDVVSLCANCVFNYTFRWWSRCGAGSLQADGLPAGPYMKYLVKLRWSIESAVFVCPH